MFLDKPASVVPRLGKICVSEAGLAALLPVHQDPLRGLRGRRQRQRAEVHAHTSFMYNSSLSPGLI